MIYSQKLEERAGSYISATRVQLLKALVLLASVQTDARTPTEGAQSPSVPERD